MKEITLAVRRNVRSQSFKDTVQVQRAEVSHTFKRVQRLFDVLTGHAPVSERCQTSPGCVNAEGVVMFGVFEQSADNFNLRSRQDRIAFGSRFIKQNPVSRSRGKRMS